MLLTTLNTTFSVKGEFAHELPTVLNLAYAASSLDRGAALDKKNLRQLAKMTNLLVRCHRKVIQFHIRVSYARLVEECNLMTR